MSGAHDLKGRVAFVSAAGRGIGRGIAEALADCGARVAVNSYSPDTTENTAGAVRERGALALALPGDITDPEVMLECKDRIVSQWGRIDILVNNVGAGPKTFGEADEGPLGPIGALWDALYRQNLKSVVLMTEAVTPVMIEQGGGKIVNISSIAGRTSLSATMLEKLVHPSYGAMKAALVSYTQTLAELLGAHNINVNAVLPRHRLYGRLAQQRRDGGQDHAGVRRTGSEGLVRRYCPGRLPAYLRPHPAWPRANGGRHRPRGGVPRQRRLDEHHGAIADGRRRHGEDIGAES